jgi:hypothetical protein
MHLVRVFFLLIVFGFLLVSCKEKELADVNVQPDQDKLDVSYTSTSNFISFVEIEDSNRTDETEFNLLGSYIDPIFGKCEAGFASQFLLSNGNPDFSYTDTAGILYPPEIDSVVLSLAYYGSYGDINKLNGIQKVEVFELTSNVHIDSVYYSNLKIDTCINSSILLASKVFLPKTNTAVFVDSIAQVPQLRINLDSDLFGKKIMGLPPFNASSLDNNENFKKYFKGLYVRVNNSFQSVNQGGILYLDLLSPFSKITTYYHNGPKKGGSFDYVISSSESARINLFKHTYAAPILNQLNNPSLGQQQIYVQAMAGLRSKITLPLLKQWIDSMPIAIHKAEIIFKIDEPFTGKYVPNSRLFLFGIDSVGKKYFLPDQSEGSTFSSQYYGGFYNETTKEYRFNIARYAQLVATKKITDNGLYLVTGTTFQTANRVVIKGGTNIQLNLTYTKL